VSQQKKARKSQEIQSNFAESQSRILNTEPEKILGNHAGGGTIRKTGSTEETTHTGGEYECRVGSAARPF
jgi:hypothetical protein